MAVGYESAIGSHVGLVRLNNQDSGYAGNRLFLVADGMGGHAGGDVASSLITREVAKSDRGAETPPKQTSLDSSLDSTAELPGEAREDPATVARELRDRVLASNRMLRAAVDERPELSGMGTTFTGFVTVDNHLSMAHIGDSRLYLLRDGVFRQITHDHTFVQRLVDSGRITEEEAKTHPRRSVLMRVLGDVDSSPEIDTDVLETRPGDVWLLCSDGLCGYVDDPDIETILKRRDSLQNAVDTLIDKSLAHGAPDNVTVVLVETVDSAEVLEEAPGPRFAGSAANDVDAEEAVSSSRTRILSRRRSIRRPPQIEESHFEPRVDEYLNELIAEMRRRNRRRRLFWAAGLLAIIAVLVGALAVGYQWTQSRYFVGTDGETVVIYQGVPQGIGSFSLYSVAEDTGIPLSSLDGLERRQIERNLSADSIRDAREIVLRLEASP